MSVSYTHLDVYKRQVYKASWPEEKVLNCTVKTLAKTAKEAGVTKTELIVVGRVLD